MFLKNITINNYKSIQKATVGFEPGLNIVIGKNGAGKSNLLEFIREFVSFHVIAGRVPKNFNLDYLFLIEYNQDTSNETALFNVKMEKQLLNGEIIYPVEITLTKTVSGEEHYNGKLLTNQEMSINQLSSGEQSEFIKEANVLKRFNLSFVSFNIPENSFWLDQPTRFEIESDLFAGTEDNHNGLGIFNFLNNSVIFYFLVEGPTSFKDVDLNNIRERYVKIFGDFERENQLNNYLSKHSPIQEIRLNPNINVYKTDNKILVENLLIDFKVNDSWVPWSYLSDGSKRLFYLITQCLSLKDGLLLIEEPELGIHPHQLFSLMQFLKEQSEEKQIIISTHSPIVLDVLRQNELNRITIAKLEKGYSQFNKLTEEQVSIAKDYMNNVAELSYYWLHSDLEDND